MKHKENSRNLLPKLFKLSQNQKKLTLNMNSKFKMLKIEVSLHPKKLMMIKKQKNLKDNSINVKLNVKKSDKQEKR